ncbi:zinc ribbon domain-containing protein [Sphingomonas spermidinifaciens]|uniref:zinc ribbon domain-containing protein n=1 Tax=Sphingomonas spermidinifaciens TaxID=1141889 RepID=UPI0011425162|nr:zinc ribbon domain-containing protein [Sphingomonas spermidinifaciens]
MAFCTDCGTELPAGARFCPSCGKPAGVSAAAAAPVGAAPQPVSHPAPPPPAARSRGGRGGARLILPVMIVVALFVIGYMLLVQRDGARPIAETGRSRTEAPSDDTRTEVAEAADAADDPTRTTVPSLDAAFKADPSGARARYDGSVTVSGTVAAVTLGGTPSLSLEGSKPFNYVIANVSDASEIGDAAKGSRINLTCDRVTALAGTTMLQGCVRD